MPELTMESTVEEITEQLKNYKLEKVKKESEKILKMIETKTLNNYVTLIIENKQAYFPYINKEIVKPFDSKVYKTLENGKYFLFSCVIGYDKNFTFVDMNEALKNKFTSIENLPNSESGNVTLFFSKIDDFTIV
jgi:hypothetical protein